MREIFYDAIILTKFFRHIIHKGVINYMSDSDYVKCTTLGGGQ